jgi:hypothetical protein
MKDRLIKNGEELARRYRELIHAVESKFPGETRHETALRYIQERERSGVCSATHEETWPKLSIVVYVNESMDGDREIEVKLLQNDKEISTSSAML